MEFIIISISSLITEGSTSFRLYAVFLSLFIFHILMLISLTIGYLIQSMYLESKNKFLDNEKNFKIYSNLIILNLSFLVLDFFIKNNLEQNKNLITYFSLFLIVGYFLLIISKNLSILKK
jgi:hypothetical protein